MLMLLAALLAVPDAEANEEPEAHIQLQAGSFFAADSPEFAVSLRAIGKKDAYIGVEGRFDGTGDWTGRVGAGIDVLGKSNFDLKVGLFMGGIGAGLKPFHGFFKVPHY